MRYRRLLYRVLLNIPILSVLLMPLLLLRCSRCPLGGLCPITVMYIGGVYGLLLTVVRKVRILYAKLVLNGRRIAPLILTIVVISSLLLAVQASPGVDKLYTKPSSITVNYGEEVKVTIRVVFAHKQPCPYPTWEITYTIDGKVDIVSESKTEVTSDGREAVKELALKPYENSTLTVVYKYGKGCPFGKEEVAKVPITVYKPVKTGITPITTKTVTEQTTLTTSTSITTVTTKTTPKTTITIETSTTTTRVTEETRVNVLEYIYNHRYVVLYASMIASLVAIFTIVGKVRHSNPHGCKNLTLVRHVVMVLILLFLVVLPIILYGFICPCPVAIPQYILLPHMLSFNPLDIYVAVIIVAFVSSLIVARLWCGWLCPLGVSQEYLAKVYGKLGMPKRIDNTLSKLKYIILVLLVVLVLLNQYPWWCYHCFIRELTTFIHAPSSPVQHIPLLIIAVVMLFLCTLIPRFFCKYLCPMGALLEILVKLKAYLRKVKLSENCKHCRVCLALKSCPMNLNKPGEPDCISCGNCIVNCPFKAVKLKR